MKLNFFLVCDNATIGSEYKPVLFGIFKNIWSSVVPSDDKPLVHPSFVAAFEISGVDKLGKGEIKLELVFGSANKVLSSQSIPFERKKESPNEIGGLVEFRQQKLPSLGDYTLNLYLDGETVGSTGFRVAKKT